MSRVIAVLVLALAISAIAHGQETPPNTAPLNTAETLPALVQPDAATSAAEAQPYSTVGAPYIAQLEQVPSRRRLSAFNGTSVVSAPAVNTNAVLTLRDPETGAAFPIPRIENGARVNIGDRMYTIELPAKTENQIALEKGLRQEIISDVDFANAPFAEAVDMLSQEGQVNIVIAVQMDLPVISLKLRSIPLYDAIRYLTEVSELTFRIDDHAVVITEKLPSPTPGRTMGYYVPPGSTSSPGFLPPSGPPSQR
jgi:hypothetical protein